LTAGCLNPGNNLSPIARANECVSNNTQSDAD
jgi:hypothetical protein